MHVSEWKQHLSRRYGRDAKSLSDVDLRGWLQGTPPTCGVLECTYVGKHPPDHAVEVSKIIEFCKKNSKKNVKFCNFGGLVLGCIVSRNANVANMLFVVKC